MKTNYLAVLNGTLLFFIMTVGYSLLFADSAEAGSDSLCRRYAKTAVEHNQINERFNCGFRGARWTSNYNGHYRWCRGASRELIRHEDRARWRAVRRPRLYVENNTEIPLRLTSSLRGQTRGDCPGGICERVKIPRLSRRTFEGFLPAGATLVTVEPLALRNQVPSVSFKFRQSHQGKGTCRRVKRLVLTDRSFGKSSIVWGGDGGGQFRVRSARHSTTVLPGNPRDLIIYWDAGRARFPVTVVYERRGPCPRGYQCSNPKMRVSQYKNPVIFKNAQWCNRGPRGTYRFPYVVYMVDASGRRSNAVNAAFNCQVR